MTNYWIPVWAAFGASALTGLIAFGLEALRARRERVERLRERRARAYSQMISRTAALALAAGALHLTAEIRSGLSEGFDIALHHRKPIEATEVHDWMMKELGPILEAMAEIWVIGTAKAVKAANELMEKCNELVGAATSRGESRSPLWQFIAGQKWTTAQLDLWKSRLDEFSLARKRLAEVARDEMGVEVTALFRSEEIEP